ncbi:MAG: restriction endonuclease subunit S [Ferruginibacter sp.]
MKHNWEIIKLGSVINYRKGFINIDNFQKYKLCRVQTKTLGVVLREQKDGFEIKTKKQQLCKAGDLIFAEMDARFGAYGIIPDELDGSIVSSHYFLYEINEEAIEKKYLEYCLTQPWFLSQVEAKGSTNYAAIRPQSVLDYNIPLPILAVQYRIVSKIEEVKSKLERIKQLRAEQTKDINNLLFSKYTELIDTAAWLPMKEVAPIIRREVKIKQEALYPELGIRCFGKGTFHKPALTGLEVATKKIFQIKKGDLVFSNVFAWEGGIAVAKEEDNDRYGSHRFISCVADKEKALEEFLCFHFLSPKGLEDINACSPGGAGRNKTLGLDKLMKIKIPVPDITLQAEFVELLHKVAAIKQHHQETEKELNELLPSLLDKAFKGELFSHSEKVVVTTAVNELEEKAFLKRKVLATYIINQSLTDTLFGDVKFEKLLHLSDFFAIKRNFGQKYFQQAAGPYDNAFTNAYFIQIEKAKWFHRRKNGKQFVFSAGQNHSKSLSTYDLFTNEELERVNKLIAYFKKCDYEQPEIISTLYAVWNNRIIKNEAITDDLLKTDFLNWDTQKIKYKDRLDAALQWMHKENIIPDGWGTLIEKAQRKHK